MGRRFVLAGVAPCIPARKPGRLALCLALLVLLACSPVLAKGDKKSDTKTDKQPAPPAHAAILKVGIVPLRDDAEQPKLAVKLAAMLKARLGARFKKVSFEIVDPAKLGSGLTDGPLLLDEAVKLGRKAGVDALLDGVFGGVQIAGGSWPSMTASFPEARGKLRWRLVECGEGLLLADGDIRPEHYKAYSQRIRSEGELQRRVLQDLVMAVGDEIEKSKVFSPGADGQPPAEPVDEGNDVIPLTPGGKADDSADDGGAEQK